MEYIFPIKLFIKVMPFRRKYIPYLLEFLSDIDLLSITNDIVLEFFLGYCNIESRTATTPDRRTNIEK